MDKIRRIATLLSLTLVLTLFPALPAAAAWPERPITILVGYAAGGGTDLTARAIAPFLEKYLGGNAKIVVVNRPGAGGEISFAALANSLPDGYTIGFINTPPVITIPIERKASFSLQQFELLGNVIDDPGNFSIHTDSPIRTLAELATEARANPGTVTVGTTGAGSDDHIAMLLFERIAKVKMNHVPFPGSSAVRTALVGKHIMVGAINIGEATLYAKGSPLRSLGQMSATRTSVAPEVATFREQGYDIELSSLRGMAAPRGLPMDVRDRLVRAVEQSAADAEFRAKSAQLYTPLRYLAPAEYDKVLRETDAAMRQLFKEVPWSSN
jgi:tripartite-type tricarboxylate transporter receptor subunit TctC